MRIAKTFHRQKYASIHPLRRFLIKRFLDEVFREIKKMDPKKVLDVGCGEGQADNYFLTKNPSLSILGIDLDEVALKKALKNNPRLQVKKGDIYQLPFTENFFDLILCLEVLEHLDGPDKVLSEIKRVGKRVIVSVPHEPFFSWASFFSGKYLRTWGRHPEHIQFWSKNQFEKLLKRHFSPVKIKTVFPWLIGVTNLKE